MNSDAPLPLTELFVLTTNRCNLSCRHCYVSSGPHGHPGLRADQILCAAQDFRNLFGRKQLTISGGEFFTRKDLVNSLPDLASLHDVFILTNGTLLTNDLARIIKPLPIAIRFGLDGASTSTHDWMRGEGSFFRLLRGLEYLLAADISPNRLEIFFTATPENYREIPAVLEIAMQNGIRRLLIEPIAVHGRAAEHWKKTEAGGSDAFRRDFELMIQKINNGPQTAEWNSKRVKANFTTPTIYYDGRVFPFTPADELDEEWGLLGNINIASLREILNSRHYREKATAKAMRHLRTSGSTAGPYRYFRTGDADAICFA